MIKQSTRVWRACMVCQGEGRVREGRDGNWTHASDQFSIPPNVMMQPSEPCPQCLAHFAAFAAGRASVAGESELAAAREQGRVEERERVMSMIQRIRGHETTKRMIGAKLCEVYLQGLEELGEWISMPEGNKEASHE